MRDILIIGLLTICLFLTMSPIDAAAQSSIDSVSSVSKEANERATQTNIAELISKLNKEEMDVLIRLSRALTADEGPAKLTPAGELINPFQSTWRDYSTFMRNNITALPAVIEDGREAVIRTVGGRGVTGNLLFGLYVLLMLFAGALTEYVADKIMHSRKSNSPFKEGEGSKFTLKIIALGFIVDIAKLTAFIAGTLFAAVFLFRNPDDHFLATSFVFYVFLILRIMMIFLHTTLAPKMSSIRLVSTDDWNAGFIYWSFVIFTGIVGVVLFLLQVMDHFQIGNTLPFRFWTGLFFFIGLLYITWRARNGLSAIIRGDDHNLTPGLERVAAWWPVSSMILIAIEYLILQLGMSTGTFQAATGTGIIAIALIVLAPFFDTMLRAIITHITPSKRGEGHVAKALYYEARYSYLRIGRVALYALMFMGVGKLWGIDYASLAKQGFGAQIAAKGGGFLLTVTIGYILWELTNLWVSRLLAKDIPTAAAEAPVEGGSGRSRLATILPLVSMALRTSIVVLTVLLGLSQLGLNITPLLAGAGVFGLAIGFGAQALVKDIVSGVFFLWDDAFRIGEFVDIEGTMGTVEKISIRSLQLRHPNGPVHVIPYGEIPKLTNNSRDYVIMKLRFTVPFDTDLEKVRKLFKQIGQEMMQNPLLADNFILPFKSQGVVDVDDVGIVIRGKFTAKPGAQWIIRKEIYIRVQKAFDENNIQFARKEVRVQIPGLDENTSINPVQKQAIAAAASEAASIDTDEKGAAKKKDNRF